MMVKAVEKFSISRALMICVLAVCGIAVSVYLLTVHWGWWSAVCLGVGDCQLVNTSRFSEFLGLPVALWGIGAYAAIFALGAALVMAGRERTPFGFARWDENRESIAAWARRLLFFTAVMGVAFSIYLTYIEVFVLYEICPWCVLSAIIVFTIALLSVVELRNAEQNEPE